MAALHAHRSSRRKTRRLAVLPAHYYHTHFCDLLTFVETRYAHAFDNCHFQFLNNFRQLPSNAQYLYVRLAGRKGSVFDVRKLRYAEISAIEDGLTALADNGFTTPVREQDLAVALHRLTKPDIVTFLGQHLSADSYKPSWKKQALIEVALEALSSSPPPLPDHLIQQGFVDELSYISFLYFGRVEDNLQKFTLRDLGLMKVPDFKADYSARFDTFAEAQSAYFYARALHRFKHGTDEDTARLIDTVKVWPEPQCDESLNARDRLLHKLGGLSERCQDIETALTLYGYSETPRCNERKIRLRYQRNDDATRDRDWVKARLEALIDNPGSDEEHIFASDFYARKFHKKRTSLVTDMLREGDTLRLDEAFRHEPERAVKRHYAAQGYAAFMTENSLWKMLFGLLFWDELYGEQSQGLHNSFDRMPTSLKLGQFYDLFQDKIEAKLKRLSRPGDTQITLLKTVSCHHGTPNGLFRWQGRTVDKIRAFLDVADPLAIGAILRLMAQDFRRMKDGFPDLMLIKGHEVRFVEVKASGDVIRRNQLTRLLQLRQAGFRTDITRIEWVVDPHQTYVVVDIETTGGKAGNHRITEIGAVKVQNGQIIDEWQSLLNPERSIPPFITRLTGITPEMVRDAPLFADILDEFATFMGDAIFVAHNVNFDYGFISAEYKRMGRSFRHPKLCTVTSMRKHYPGLRSYSLKNLCERFNIDLTSHHRALCDAKAATELLFLVNDKRLAARPEELF